MFKFSNLIAVQPFDEIPEIISTVINNVNNANDDNVSTVKITQNVYICIYGEDISQPTTHFGVLINNIFIHKIINKKTKTSYLELRKYNLNDMWNSNTLTKLIKVGNTLLTLSQIILYCYKIYKEFPNNNCQTFSINISQFITCKTRAKICDIVGMGFFRFAFHDQNLTEQNFINKLLLDLPHYLKEKYFNNKIKFSFMSGVFNDGMQDMNKRFLEEVEKDPLLKDMLIYMKSNIWDENLINYFYNFDEKTWNDNLLETLWDIHIKF